MLAPPRISVIIPFHNAAHCVTTMLDCLARQNIPMEIIAVDDASNDGGGDVVHGWGQNNIPVTILRNERQMYAYGSRLRGMAQATAPVVYNVDADDTLYDDACLERALTLMESSQVDILHCKSMATTKGSRLHQTLEHLEPIAESLHGGDIFHNYINRFYPPCTVWNKLLSRKLVQKILAVAPNICVQQFDDKIISTILFLHATSYIGCNEIIYVWKRRKYFSADQYAQQVNALYELREACLDSVREQAGEAAAKLFCEYVDRRIAVHGGHISLCQENENIKSISKNRLLSAIFLSMFYNLGKLQNLEQSISDIKGKNADLLRETLQIFKKFGYGKGTLTVEDIVNFKISKRNISKIYSCNAAFARYLVSLARFNT